MKNKKDHCTNCSVEPPAMKFKCPECEHNPDNENNLAKDINVLTKAKLIEQLISKTQECEHWKLCYEQSRDNNKSIIKTFVETSEKDIDRYRKALEEIEKVCLEDIHTFADETQVRYDSLDDIIDIINKVKEG